MSNSPLLIAFLFVLSHSAAVCRADPIKVVGKLRHEENLEGSVEAVAISPDGTLLASGYNVRVGASPWISKQRGQDGEIKGTVLLWDLAKREVLRSVNCGGGVRFLAFRPDGKRLAEVHLDEQGKQHVRVLDTANGKDRYSTSVGVGNQQPFLTALAFSPDGKDIVVGANDGEGALIVLLESATGEQRKTLKAGGGAVFGLSFSADGKLMTSVSESHVTVWDVAAEKERNSFSVGRGHLATISPDGGTIAVATIGSRNYGGKVALTLNEAKSGKELIDFKCLRSGPAVQFTRDGKRLIHVLSGIVTVYDSRTGKQLALADGPPISSLGVSPKDNLIATGNTTGSVWLWEVESE